MCINNYKLDPSYFYLALGLSWQACFKKTKVKLELLTDEDMLLMVESGIEEECVNLHIDMLKQI